MTEIERRHSVRFAIPNAQVHYATPTGMKGNNLLIDMSKSGVSFLSKHNFPIGEELNLRIELPDNENLSVKGTVLRVGHNDSYAAPFTVVLFYAFGTYEKYNSFMCHEQINQIVEAYSKFQYSA